ncbi:hypothetical protein FK220_008010 [Flavobacteriaceae bacterium TP-CH-4]|uniref:Lipoprotein n=1 Tax=Pelagihabitans pacificus TaxID=2696054 RepID=A0A967E658_9FLAO|nr:hypothetical protein [Pelagihabitans pacificus]NHF59280.1 hypothetical protein [Pelagihabitans pacificus]
MKKILFSGIFSFLLLACGGVKKTQEAVNSGNYGNAIDKSIRNLVGNKSKKGNQPYILLLEEAYQKNTERELQRIAFLEKEENPANYEAIFKGYSKLRTIQQRIRPLLPLYIIEENRDAKFSFRNYENELLDAKDQLSEYLYDNASDLLENATNKQDYRKAYDDFTYLNEINPGFEDTKQRMEEAHAKGLDYVKVAMVNETDQIIPERLQEELLNFNTYGLDELWTRYHTTILPNVAYDYDMQVAFREINISPEQVNEKQIIKEKQVKDGYRYAVDTNGNVVRDSLGNKIKIDNFKTVRCDFYQFTQFKAAQVTGQVRYKDLSTEQEINSYPLSSEFVFEHVYADYNGDKRALDTDLVPLLNLAAVPFPTNEQMVYDAGEDLKSRLKNIILRHRFN